MFALDILNQLQNENGTLLSNGRVYVYYLGRTRLADIYNDVDGQTPLPNPVILDNLGMSEIYLSNAYDYTVVVTDPYGTELFSRDIFTSPLQEGGANARLYEGWDPIVVNNNVNVISAKMATFGVESPLYFAEDSESATVIGISGELGKIYSGIEPIVVNNELNKISANTKTLSAETPLYITDYEDKTVISVQSAVLGVEEPLYFVENSETATVIGIQGSAVIPSGTMNESAFGYEDGKITGYNGSGFSAGLNYSGIEPIVVNNAEAKISANTIDLTGISPIEVVEYNDLLVISANLSSYATNSALSSKLDTSSFSSVSGDFLTAVPDEYATKDYVISSISSKLDVSSFSSVSSTFLTAVPAGTMNESAFGYDASSNITAYNGSAFKAGDEFPQSATEAVETVINSSATWNTVSSKLDTSASADFELVNSTSKTYSAIMPIDTKYITEVQPATIRLRNENGEGETEQYTQITQDSLKISGNYNQGNYVNLNGDGLTISSHNSGFAEFNSERYSAWNEVSAKLDTTAFSNVSGTFLTAHQDLSDYLTTADSANFYTTANESGFITGIDLTPYQTTAGMTAYQEVLEFGYDNTNNISAINNSGITRTPSRDLYVREPLYTGMSGTSAYIGVYESAIQPLVFGYTAIGE